MKEIKYLKTTQAMVFPSDDIYFYGLNSEPAIQKILSAYSLSRVPLPPQFPIQLPQLIFQNGIFANDKNTYIIEQLSIDDRKIIINILSSSDISDLFFKELKKLLMSLDLRDDKGSYEPLVRTYETTCILKLDIKLNRLISNVKLNEIEELIATTHNYGAKISFIPFSVRFQISYNDIPEKLVKNKISISDKSLLIELRDKTDPDDQIYFTVSPTDTETHLELLKTIEKMLA
jgi:hypothetical protein